LIVAIGEIVPQGLNSCLVAQWQVTRPQAACDRQCRVALY
jgi:hypothetical protein